MAKETFLQRVTKLASEIEHSCEYNVNETLEWSLAEQKVNNQAIVASRALWDLAGSIAGAEQTSNKETN